MSLSSERKSGWICPLSSEYLEETRSCGPLGVPLGVPLRVPLGVPLRVPLNLLVLLVVLVKLLWGYVRCQLHIFRYTTVE